MTGTMTVDEAMDAVYESLANDNDNIDTHIRNLKAALAAAGQKQAHVQPERLIHNNRSGRKLMQSYFKKRGVKIVFDGQE